MPGKFNPFQSKQAEVMRTHNVGGREKALKIFEKLQRKRPYVWIEVEAIATAAAEQKLNELTGETSVALFVNAMTRHDLAAVLTPALDALVVRLWKSFNKLHIIQRVEKSGETAGLPCISQTPAIPS